MTRTPPVFDNVLRRVITTVPWQAGSARYDSAPTNPHVCTGEGGGEWYPPVLLGANEIGARAMDIASLHAVSEVLRRLTSDEYVEFLLHFFAEYQKKAGWGRYADLTTALWAAVEIASPRNYLEIGVRRGRSLCIVASSMPKISIVGFDIWLANYAGMPNPGPEFVRAEAKRIGHRGNLHLVSGNSHIAVPRYIRENAHQYFDLIVVDGDHTRRGASLDLRNVLPRLAVGGVVILDDIAHPKHPHLSDVWKRYVGSDPRFSSWEYTDTGFGVAVGVRKY